MIVPMRKVALLVLDREREDALRALRKLGVVHVERRDAASATISELQALISRLDQAAALIHETGAKPRRSAGSARSREETLQAAERAIALGRELAEARESLKRVEAELERLAPWGEVDPESFRSLAGRGLILRPFEIPLAEYSLIPDGVSRMELDRDKKRVRALLWAEGAFPEGNLPPGARELALPASSTKSLRDERDRLLAEVPRLSESLALERESLTAFLALKVTLLKELEFETVRAGMPLVSFGSETAIARDSALAWLTGFIPASEETRVVEEAKARHWALTLGDPAEDDVVPTKLRNNPLVNLITPLIDFLGIVPGYREIDISGWFVLFFGLFFAMIFGDGGYGVILAVVSLALIASKARKRERIPTAFFMFLYLSCMTVAWGAITCTWFGLAPGSLPEFLRAIALPAFSNENPDAPGNIKLFCFTIALAQLSIAHVIGFFRNVRTLKALGELGSLMMLAGMFFVVLYLVVDGEKYPITTITVAAIGGGFLLNFVFVNYAGSVVASVIESLKNFITMFLGVVNVFGDIMSYIRLWAVGLAGSAISATVNSMVGPMFGSFLAFLAVLVLFFGHGLNLVMNVLSVIVHGVRLNTLEFSNHLGLTWSGFKYEPFSETGNE